MNVILLDIAVVSKDYQGCLLKPSRASVWSLRRDQSEFTCPAVPSRLLVAFQSLRYLEQRQRMVLAGCRARWCPLCLPHSTGESGPHASACWGTLSLVFYWAWHCLGSCSSFHFKQSKFTGGLYLPLTPSYTITLVVFYLQLMKNRVE